MRVVADTNVIISALVFGGVPRKIFELAESRFLDIFYSPDIQAETRRILLQKFGWDEPRMDWYLARLWNLGTTVVPSQKVKIVVDDPDDDRILECALAADADVLISGDKHLLALDNYRTIPIMTPRQFLDTYT